MAMTDDVLTPDQWKTLDYDGIKAMAKRLGVSVRDLLVLAPQNDPFYRGSPGDMAQGEWFQRVWQAGGFSYGAHLRRTHYWCTSQPDLKMHNDMPYLNTDD